MSSASLEGTGIAASHVGIELADALAGLKDNLSPGKGASGGDLLAAVCNGGAQSDPGALTDSTGGTAHATLAAIGDTSSSNEGGAINDNFASLAAKVEALRAALVAQGMLS
jgi:hypothetical protein